MFLVRVEVGSLVILQMSKVVPRAAQWLFQGQPVNEKLWSIIAFWLHEWGNGWIKERIRKLIRKSLMGLAKIKHPPPMVANSYWGVIWFSLFCFKVSIIPHYLGWGKDSSNLYVIIKKPTIYCSRTIRYKEWSVLNINYLIWSSKYLTHWVYTWKWAII